MSDLNATFCPVCRKELASAEAVHAGGNELIGPQMRGTYENNHGHVVVESSEIRMYSHADDGDENGGASVDKSENGGVE